jgi:cytochrome c oxidase assembly factor CtaG
MAMPLFDWGAGAWGSIVSDRFWIYWAVTVPLTMIIGIIVTRWILMGNRRDKDREIAERFVVRKERAEMDQTGNMEREKVVPVC